jgi:predicted nuclease with TOPRIM domain
MELLTILAAFLIGLQAVQNVLYIYFSNAQLEINKKHLSNNTEALDIKRKNAELQEYEELLAKKDDLLDRRFKELSSREKDIEDYFTKNLKAEVASFTSTARKLRAPKNKKVKA